jgi:hypothetical protein
VYFRFVISFAQPYASSFQKATPEEPDHPASQQITHERNTSLNSLPSQPTGVDDKPGCHPLGDEDDEGPTKHLANLVAPDYPSGKEISRMKDGHPIELGQRVSEAPVAKTEQDRRIAQLTDEVTLKSALLEQAAEEKNRAGLELRELQAKLGGLLLSHEQAEANAAEEKKRAGLELRELQAKFDRLLLSHEQAEANAAEEKKREGELQAKLDEQGQRELTEMRAELEARKSELAAFRLPLADTENDYAKSKTEADTYRNQDPTGLVNTDEDRVVHRLMERMQVMEAEIASLRWNEKNFETMECRNEG